LGVNMERMVYLAIVLSIILITPLVKPVYTYGQHTPHWSYRVISTEWIVEDVWESDLDYDASNLYLALDLKNDTIGHTVGIIVVNTTTGEIKYGRIMPIGYDEYVGDIDFDERTGYVYLAGYAYNSSTGRYNAFIIRATRDLSNYDYTVLETNYDTFFYGIRVTPGGSIYCVGSLRLSNGIRYILVAKYTVNLELINWRAWTYYADPDSGWLWNATAFDVDLDYNGNIYALVDLEYYEKIGDDEYYSPLFVGIMKINSSLYDVEYIWYDLRNSDNNYYYSRLGIIKGGLVSSTDGQYIYTAFTATDDYDTAGTPAIAVVKLYWNGTDFEEVWKKVLATQEWEWSLDIYASEVGEVVVAGATTNDYGVDLGTSYYHQISLVLEPDGSLHSSVIGGNTSGAAIGYTTVLSRNGYVFIGGYLETSVITYYDVTNETSIQVKGVGRIDKEHIGTYDGPRITDLELVEAEFKPLKVENILINDLRSLSMGKIGDSVGVSGSTSDDTALMTLLDIQIQSPPPPVPEPFYVVLISAVTIAVATIVIIRFVRR